MNPHLTSPVSTRSMITSIVPDSATDLETLANDENFLSNPQLFRFLMEETSERAAVFTHAERICDDLSFRKGKVIVLVDFDIVRPYIEAQSNRDYYLEILHFFEYSDFFYGLPGGAFDELLDYLSGDQRGEQRGDHRFGVFGTLIREAITRTNFRPTSDFLEQLIDIVKSEDNRTQHEKEASLDDVISILDRLVSLLTSPRFTRMYSYSDKILENDIFEMMRDYRNPNNHRERSSKPANRLEKSNKIDAKNIAIVFGSLQGENQSDPNNTPRRAYDNTSGESLILLTTTSSVLKISKELRRYTRGFFHVAVRPDHLFVPSLLGAAKDANAAGTKAFGLKQRYQDSSDQLRQLINDLRSEPGAKGRIISQFKHVVGNLGEDRLVKSIDEQRSNCIAIPMFYKAQHLHGLTGSMAHPRYTSFIRLLQRLHSIFNHIVPSYTLKEEKTSDTFSYSSYSISNTAHPDQHASESVIAKIRLFRETANSPRRTQVQWVIDIDEIAFLQSLADSTCPISFAQPDSSHEMVAVVTRHKRWTFSAKAINECGGLAAMSLSSLQSLIQSGRPVFSRDIIEEIVIHGPSVTVVFDIVPAESTGSRRLTVLFEGDVIASFVLHLYSWTGSRILAPRAFEEALATATHQRS
jgi:hypothetical protein